MWVIPALKAVLPHLGTIVAAATPVFTTLRSGAATGPAALQQQIAERQSAVSQNAAHIRELAEPLQGTVTALEKGAASVEAKLRQARLLCGLSVLLSMLAAGLALVALLAH
jgi:hypothetical protein